MERYELQRLRELPIEAVAERCGLRLTRHKSLCPFHDDTHPSLSFDTRRNTFRCFVCGEHGGVIDLAMRLLRMDFIQACRWLADGSIYEPIETKHTIKDKKTITQFDAKRYERFFDRPFLSETARHFLFTERRLDERVIRWCRLTSWRDRQGICWLQTPYYDVDGHLIGVQHRNLSLSLSLSLSPSGEKRGDSPRFRFPYGSRCGIYNLPVLRMLRHDEDLWITEGCSDCWAMLSSGHKAIAIPSATLLKQHDIEQLSTLISLHSNKLHMFPDADVPGERLFLALKTLLPTLQHHPLPLGCKDYSDYYIQQKQKEADNG